MKEWSIIYIRELGEFKSVFQLLQVIVSLEGGPPKAILNGGWLVKSIGHTGDGGGGG